MTIRAVNYYFWNFMGFNIRATGYFMRLDGMAGGAFNALYHMNVGILRGRNAVLVIRAPACACMTAQTHLACGFLDILGSLKDVHAIGRNDLELIPFLSYFSLIIRGMTN